jgi:hypothetical protein
MGVDRGFVLLHRKFWDNPLLQEIGRPYSKREAWLDMFSNLANGVDRNGFSRGEFSASKSFLAKRWLWSETSVRRFLVKLQEHGMISKQLRNEISADPGADHQADRFNICNYETYQTSRTPERTTKRTQLKELLKESIKEKNIYTGKVLCTIPCKGGNFEVYEDLVLEWENAYPGVDVRGELFRMVIWSKSKPNGYGWTVRGCQKGINTWLAGNFSKISSQKLIANIGLFGKDL